MCMSPTLVLVAGWLSGPASHLHIARECWSSSPLHRASSLTSLCLSQVRRRAASGLPRLTSRDSSVCLAGPPAYVSQPHRLCSPISSQIVGSFACGTRRTSNQTQLDAVTWCSTAAPQDSPSEYSLVHSSHSPMQCLLSHTGPRNSRPKEPDWNDPLVCSVDSWLGGKGNVLPTLEYLLPTCVCLFCFLRVFHFSPSQNSPY